MRWPEHAVETVRPSRFWPPFCPWPGCATHRQGASHFQRHGTYLCASARAPIPRFRCSSCKRTCSRQTFSTTYYLKRRTLQPAVAAGLVAGSAHRQIARSLDCAKTSVTRQAQRLARHAILFQAHALEQLGAIAERIAYDHFESFIGRQDRALAIGTPLGARSWFCYGADFAPHRRAGRGRPPATIPSEPCSTLYNKLAATVQ